jgi:hypothetical protein
MGIASLFGAELGMQSLTSFFEFVGVTLLSIVCPPLGAAVGIILAERDYEKALERKQLYQSLIDPELVLTWAEVETELFAARLGLALAIIPEAGSILKKGVSTGVRLGARGSIRAAASSARRAVTSGVRGAERSVVNYLTRETIKSLERSIVRILVEDLLTGEVISEIMEQVMTPILKHVQQEAERTGAIGGYAGAERLLQRLEQEAQEASGSTSGGTDLEPQQPDEDELIEDDELEMPPDPEDEE